MWAWLVRSLKVRRIWSRCLLNLLVCSFASSLNTNKHTNCTWHIEESKKFFLRNPTKLWWSRSSCPLWFFFNKMKYVFLGFFTNQRSRATSHDIVDCNFFCWSHSFHIYKARAERVGQPNRPLRAKTSFIVDAPSPCSMRCEWLEAEESMRSLYLWCDAQLPNWADSVTRGWKRWNGLRARSGALWAGGDVTGDWEEK